MKPTDTNLGKFYGLTRQTVATYREKKQNLYKAMVDYYMNSGVTNYGN